ncbi:ATP synthase protein I2 [Desulfosporosinus metallidurans]|uniref:ATP synthase protein I2 n=1 Tax=Desulfosporosinus metallidurans TaxID=1888891 RepID=A0A1Q8R2W6_9FIRM|nr:ATP synthase protein I2 [Desulfosporosinus metallidurans]
MLIVIAITGQPTFMGSLVGYWVGFGYTIWFRRDVLRSSELDTRSALGQMRRSLLARLGMITLVVVAVARFQASWLYSLALGIAFGVIASFITVAIHQNSAERGDKKSA